MKHVWVYPGAPACDAMDWLKTARMDVIRVEFFKLNSSGLLTRINEVSTDLADTCNGFSEHNVAAFKQLATTGQVLVTVSGNDTDSQRKMFVNADSVVRQLVNFVIRWDLGGVDMDLEAIGNWTQADFTAYTLFLNKLGDALHVIGKKLSLCCPVWSGLPDRPPFPWSYPQLAKLPIDYFSIMMYDQMWDDGGGTPIASLNWIDSFMSYLSKTLPLQKIVQGLPAYGYSGTMYSWSGIRNRTKKEALPYIPNSIRDPASAELVYHNGTTVWFINDKMSLQKKAAIGAKYGITSTSIWHAGGGNDYL
jgi:spore germination protein YaaH